MITMYINDFYKARNTIDLIKEVCSSQKTQPLVFQVFWIQFYCQ